MGKNRFGLFIFVLVALWSFPGHAMDQEDNEEFIIKKQYEMDKIEDFYDRLGDLDRIEAERRSGEDEMRAERKQTAVQNEAARQEFVKLRKQKPPEDPTTWENELKEQARQHELARREFVKHRQAMDKLLKGVGRIPEEDEYDIGFEVGE